MRTRLPVAADDEVDVEVTPIEQAGIASAGEVRAIPGAFALTAALVGHPWAIVTSGNRRAAGLGVDPRGAVVFEDAPAGIVRTRACIKASSSAML